jgi:NAD(P)-dependent dehydrogenase (short-subunit alcohol dehydrogenase family)
MKVILITGSSSGFGLEMVHDLTEQGHHVIATLRRAEERKAIFDSVKDKSKLTILSLDVCSKEDIKHATEHIKQAHNGELDVLINNAGYGLYGALEDVSEDQIRQQMEVNFFGAALLTQELLPALRKVKGKIINISSVMGRFSLPLGSIYSASKFALEGLSEGLYYELKPFGVQVCAVQPGAHRTGFVKAMMWGDKSNDDASAYINQTKALIKNVEQMTDSPLATGSENVSNIVTKLIKKRKMPRRVLAGKDAVATGFAQKFLPEALYHELLHRSYEKVFGSKI